MLTSPSVNIKSPCITPPMPSFGRCCNADSSLVASSGCALYHLSMSAAFLQRFGSPLANTDLVPIKNLLSLGSMPQIIAGAPSHLTVSCVVAPVPSANIARKLST